MSPDTDLSPLPETTVPFSRWLFPLAGLLFLAALTAGVTLLFLALSSATSTVAVTLVVGGDPHSIQTRAGTVRELLTEQEVAVNENDVVSPELDSPLLPGMTVQISRARSVTLSLDGEAQTLQTLFTNPLDILNEVGVQPGALDRVWVDGTRAGLMDLLVWPVPASHIRLRRAVPVHIEDDGQTRTIQTASETVGEALFEAGVNVYLADTVSPDFNTPVSRDMRITIRRSSPISIVADGVTLETRAQGTTVADALVHAGVVLMGLDYAIPDETSSLQPGMVIRVIRVTEQVISEQEAIPFETVYQADSTLELDQKAVLQEGQNGILRHTVRIRYENGVEVSREVESSETAVEAQNRIVRYGTQVVIRTIDTPDGPREYWRRFRMYATSYHPAALGGDNITATGRVLTKGVVGIDPTLIPYGTQLYVPGYGVGVAADTGGPRRTRFWIDLGYDDANWISWSREIDVYLLTPVPAEIDYLLTE